MSNIKNIVVLVQQNLPFDHFAGGLDYDSSIDPDAAGIAAAPRLGATRSRERAILMKIKSWT
jgi:phospholipase C